MRLAGIKGTCLEHGPLCLRYYRKATAAGSAAWRASMRPGGGLAERQRKKRDP